MWVVLVGLRSVWLLLVRLHSVWVVLVGLCSVWVILVELYSVGHLSVSRLSGVMQFSVFFPTSSFSDLVFFKL